ncbi:hypothetical protein [Rhodopirellula sallentina]|uniref:Uncharacterized protein n=1 Tax=Rhodopirellula sallentina SM41 TaxID=1263870 RepID=M5U4G4_9BACT|nr:hypothetical protein [Rhodopirellula sallentina]EMI56347.1 hypothetical protein RSSM_02227 [Rhodopirellula sallentina SM41]
MKKRGSEITASLQRLPLDGGSCCLDVAKRRSLRLLRGMMVGCVVWSVVGGLSGRASAQESELEAASEVESPSSPPSYSKPHLPSDQIAGFYRSLAERKKPGTGNTDDGLEVPMDAPEGAGDGVAGEHDGESEDAQADSSAKHDATPAEIQQWIDQLGSVEFAAREQATAKLRDAGKRALALLEEASREHPDLEVRTRAADVSKGITGGETAGRIDAFLAGDDVELDGWEVFQSIMGDGVRIRELYVDFLMRHGEVAASLDVTSKAREAAFQKTIVDVQRGMFVEQRSPTEADLIALMLLANDHDMPITRVEENAIFTVLRRDATAKLLSDSQLSGAFRAMLGGWISREDVVNRQEMLWFALSWDLTETLPLALVTLEKATDPVTLGMAMQAIARFGDLSNVPEVAKFLDDYRPASEQQYAGGTLVQAFVSDAAAAAIILLNDRSLDEFALNAAAEHPKYGFIVQEIGFPTEDPKPRKDAIEKLKKELLSR